MSAPWPRSIHPRDRDPAIWNPLMDGIAKLYRHAYEGERFAGMTVTLIDGDLTSVLLLEQSGGVRRLTLRDEAGTAAELECEDERGEERVC